MESFPMVSSIPQMQQPSLSQQPVPWMLTIPSYIPWSDPTCHKDTNIMKFTAEPAFHINPSAQLSAPGDIFDGSESQENIKNFYSAAQPQFKRKGNHLDSIPPPNKMYISEEKMVARMKELNISNNCSSESKDMGFTHDDQSHFDQNATLEEIESKLILDYDDLEDLGPSTSGEPILIFSQELKQNMPKTEPILPATILEKMQKPTMEVVLWKPPGGIVSSLIKSSTVGMTDNGKRTRQRKPTSGNSSVKRLSDLSSSSIMNNNNNYIDEEVLMERKESAFPMTVPTSLLMQAYSSISNYPSSTENVDRLEQMEL